MTDEEAVARPPVRIPSVAYVPVEVVSVERAPRDRLVWTFRLQNGETFTDTTAASRSREWVGAEPEEAVGARIRVRFAGPGQRRVAQAISHPQRNPRRTQ